MYFDIVFFHFLAELNYFFPISIFDVFVLVRNHLLLLRRSCGQNTTMTNFKNPTSRRMSAPENFFLCAVVGVVKIASILMNHAEDLPLSSLSVSFILLSSITTREVTRRPKTQKEIHIVTRSVVCGWQLTADDGSSSWLACMCGGGTPPFEARTHFLGSGRWCDAGDCYDLLVYRVMLPDVRVPDNTRCNFKVTI